MIGPILYVVFRQGVYRHECGGVFDTLVKAEEAASGLAEEDSDNYHTYEVRPFVLNLATSSEGEDAYGGTPLLQEHEVLFSIRKGEEPNALRRNPYARVGQ